MSQSPFETLPVDIVMLIASHLDSWRAAHKVFMCTTRAARFGTKQRGRGARMMFLRYFSACISILERYEECLMEHVFFDAEFYSCSPLDLQPIGCCKYNVWDFEIKYTDWKDICDHLYDNYERINTIFEEEVASLISIPGSDHYLIKTHSRVGKILEKNKHLEVVGGTKIPFYAVEESLMIEILALFNKNNINITRETDNSKNGAITF